MDWSRILAVVDWSKVVTVLVLVLALVLVVVGVVAVVTYPREPVTFELRSGTFASPSP